MALGVGIQVGSIDPRLYHLGEVDSLVTQMPRRIWHRSRPSSCHQPGHRARCAQQASRTVATSHATALAAAPEPVAGSSGPACLGPSGLCAPHARAFRVETTCPMTSELPACTHTQSFAASCPCRGPVAARPAPQVLPRSVSEAVAPQHRPELRRVRLRGGAGHRAARL